MTADEMIIYLLEELTQDYSLDDRFRKLRDRARAIAAAEKHLHEQPANRDDTLPTQ